MPTPEREPVPERARRRLDAGQQIGGRMLREQSAVARIGLEQRRVEKAPES